MSSSLAEGVDAFAGGDDEWVVVPDGDVGGGEVAAARVAVAASFEELSVVLAGDAAQGFGDDVVDVAAVDRVTSRRRRYGSSRRASRARRLSSGRFPVAATGSPLRGCSVRSPDRNGGFVRVTSGPVRHERRGRPRNCERKRRIPAAPAPDLDVGGARRQGGDAAKGFKAGAGCRSGPRRSPARRRPGHRCRASKSACRARVPCRPRRSAGSRRPIGG